MLANRLHTLANWLLAKRLVTRQLGSAHEWSGVWNGPNLSIDLHLHSRISVDDTASVEEFGA